MLPGLTYPQPSKLGKRNWGQGICEAEAHGWRTGLYIVPGWPEPHSKTSDKKTKAIQGLASGLQPLLRDASIWETISSLIVQ